MTSLLSHILTYVVLFLFIDAVNAASTAVVWVQDSVNASPYWGWFSTRFVGLTLNSASVSTVVFQAGDLADDSWVVSYPDIEKQTASFFENSFTFTIRSPGTWWFYLASRGTLLNFDFVQVRVVANSWTGEITPKFDQPPFTWRYGYPPNGIRFTSGTDATGNDGTVATLSDPIMTSIPSSRRSSTSTSTSTSVWLAPLLVGIIMIAMTVPIVMCAYKKGKQHAKPAQVQEESAAIENQEQQRDQQNRVQMAVV